MKATLTKAGVTLKCSDDDIFYIVWALGNETRNLKKKAASLRKDRNEAEKEGATPATIKALTDMIEEADREIVIYTDLRNKANRRP